MDLQLATGVQRLRKAVADTDTQQLWILVTAAIEAGFVDYFSLKGKDADNMNGRSKIRTTLTDGGSLTEKRKENPNNSEDSSHESAAAKRIREVKR